MEFITYPWMHSFFKEDTNKYLYHHMSGAIKFLPYGVLVDHFNMKFMRILNILPKSEWLVGENWKRCICHIKLLEIPILRTRWLVDASTAYFYGSFYYIDYALAQVCALQFWSRFEKKDSQAFSDYQGYD